MSFTIEDVATAHEARVSRRNHYEGCWKEHAGCAIRILANHCKRLAILNAGLSAEVDTAKRVLSDEVKDGEDLPSTGPLVYIACKAMGWKPKE